MRSFNRPQHTKFLTRPRSLLTVQASCPESEFVVYREFVSQVMSTMLTDFMNPLYARHPDLKPPELT
ncbi:hypothetical protein [Burkholderia multivorans]|uniref:hypothetical protein n=1 Tax=Burkholderia multivorans TaxID=87883 RepID=UPI0031FCC6EA